MRYIGFVLLTFSLFAHAGDFHYEAYIDTYDPDSGLYYKAVEASPGGTGFLGSKSGRGAVVNLNIFDPRSGTSSLLFPEPQTEGISVVLFETGIVDEKIQFNGSTHSSKVMNNTQIAKRALRDRLLVGVRAKDTKETVFFVSDKRGAALKRWLSVPHNADWHIDAKNSKFRVVQQKDNSVKIESYDW